MSMARVKEIEEYVERLYDSVNEKPRGQEAKQTAEDLTTTIGTNITEKDIDYILSTLFNTDNGLVRFLSKAGSIKDKDVCSAVSIILGFLVEFIPKRKKNLPTFQLYAIDLKKQCLNISKFSIAKCRVAAIDLLIVLIDRKNKFDVSDFDIQTLYQSFTELYTLPKTKLPMGAKAKIIELLGKIARYYPEIPGDHGLQLIKRWCFDDLNSQMKSDRPEGQAVAGGLYCLNNILYCEEDSFVASINESADKLFHIIFIVLSKYQDTSRYTAVQAALELFSNHTSLFGTMLTTPEHWKDLFNILETWASHQNVQTKKFALNAFDQYIRQLSVVLYLNHGGAHEQHIFRYVMGVFGHHLDNAEDLEKFEKVSLSIRGVGYFARACTKIMTPEELNVVHNALIKISDWFYASANPDQKEYLRHIPAFIKAYTMFAEELNPIPVDLMQTLHNMCNIFVNGFVNMSGYHRRNGIYNMRSLFNMLYKKGEGLFRNFLNDIFEKALICTCTDIKTEYEKDRPAYDDMLYFWKILLNNPLENKNLCIKTETLKTENTQTDEQDENEEIESSLFLLYSNTEAAEPANLADTLYDSFLLAVLKLTKGFNLKLKNISEEAETNEEGERVLNTLSTTLRPVNQKDFLLYQNLVDFWCLILKELDNKRLEHWVYIVGTVIIDQSVLNPLVSGFYRMMSEIMIVCEKRQFFLGCKTYSTQSKWEKEHEKNEAPSEYATYVLFKEYLKEVWHRLQQFTDELLASCLRLILAYPIAFFDIEELITPLEKALKLGITYHPLATIAMNSLDKLLDPNLGFNINTEFLTRILPCINEYLLVGVVSASKDTPTIKQKTYKVSTANQRRYQTVHIKTTPDQIGVARSKYSSLPDLQLRMMQFLGRLGGKNKQLLLQGNDSIQNNDMLAWDPVKRLKIRIPFRNTKVDVCLDEFLPKICELAEHSPDRQVKVAACELLHGLALFMIGNAAFKPKDSTETTESDYHKLYLKIFPVMLRLAIDPDQVARDMFRLLYAQLIHWLTNNAHSENPETMALLHTCLEAACSADAGLRDYGAECTQEFVKWSIKQTSRSTDGAMNIKSLLKRLYNLMSNPNSTKRLGASLVFNQIYRLFREESVLVNEYTLEILGQLFLSLKMAEVDHPSIGTRDQTIEAISHIKRILRAKDSVFIKEDPSRRPFIGSEYVTNLESVVHWTFVESGKTQRTYAKVCMNFFVEFVTRIPKIKSAKDWLSKYTIENSRFYVDVYETDRISVPIDFSDETKMISTYTSWIKRLNSAVDGYTWLIERDVLDPFDLCNNLESNLLNALHYFVTNSPYDLLEDALNQSIIERMKVLSIYAHISVRIIYFLHLVFKSSQSGNESFRYFNERAPAILYDEQIMELIARTLLMPKKTSELIQSDQGNAATNSGVTRIYNIAKDYVLLMHEKSPLQFMASFTKSVAKVIHDEKVNILFSAEYSSERSLLIDIIQTVEGIKLLQSIGTFGMICKELHRIDRNHPENADAYCELVFDQYLKFSRSIQDPLCIQVLGNSLIIVFSQEGFAEKHASELLGFSGRLEHLNIPDKLNVYQKYKEYIFECMANYFQDFYPVLGANIESTLLRNYTSMFLEYLKTNKHSQRKLVFHFSDHLVKDPTFLELLITNSKSEDQILDLINSLKLLFEMDPAILSRSKRKPIFDILWNAFISFFERSNPFVIKNSALDLLPIYICLDPEYGKTVIEKLNESIVENFPHETESLKKGTVLYNEIISYLDKLLDTMSKFKSVEIFNMLIGVFVQEQHHIHEEVVKKSLESFTVSIGLNKFLEVANMCFKEFKNDQHSNLQRHNLSDLIISLSVGVDDGAVIAFYEENIEYILATIQKEAAMSGYRQLQDWNIKTDCLCLLQLYNRLPKEFFTPNNVVYEKWLKSPKNSTKKKLPSVIIKAVANLRKSAMMTEVSANDNGRRNAQLLYNRAVFNSLIAMMVCVAERTDQTDNIFKDDDFNRYCWDYIVDTKQNIQLGIQWDKPLARSKINDLRTLSGYSTERNERSISYMASVALTGSSFTQTSLSEAILETQTNSTTNLDKDVTMTPVQDGDTEMTEAESSIISYGDEANEFEIDVLNDNSFMKPLTELIKKLHEVIIKPGEHPIDTPTWVKRFLKAFNSSENQINIQIYLAKLIDNYPFAFSPYATSWFLPLMEFITKGGKFGVPMNYLVQDLCIILIIWGKNHELPSSGSDATARVLYNFVEFLIKNAYHSDQRIMRSNIQIIKGVFENWGKLIPIPTRAIYEQFTFKKDLQHQNIVGLQVLSIVFLNGANPYDSKYSDIYDLPEKQFYTAMAYNVMYVGRKKRDISADTAELMGMTINYMRENNHHLLYDLYEHFRTQLEFLSNSRDHSTLQFLKCINRVYLRDVQLAKESVSLVQQKLRKYSNAEKLLAMQFLGVCWAGDDMIFQTLENAGLNRMISDRDEKMQLAVLTVLNKIFEVLKIDEIKKVIKRISKAFADHEKKECRALYYGFLKKAFTFEEMKKDMRDDIKALLFQGLIDKERSISTDINNFIEKTFEITDNIYDAVEKITRDMYMTRTEDIYLLYATCMVLNNTKKSADFEQPIFNEPLPHARFDADYQHINTSWQTTSSMMPLFKSTQTQVIDTDDLELELNQTQSLLDFSVTQGANRSLLSTFNPNTDGPIDDPDINSEVLTKRTTLLSKLIDLNENPYSHKRKRFNISTPGSSNRFHSDRNQRLEKKMQTLKNTYHEALEKKVNLTRSYRVGELPDVQIKFKDLLLPLEVLASADYNISRLLYSSLVVCIVQTNKSNDSNYENALVQNIQRNIDDSTLNFTPTIGSFLRIFFDLDIVDQPGSLVRSASTKSSNQHIGIALLEKQLDIISRPSTTGKRKHSYDEDDENGIIISSEEKEKRKNLWIDLSLLYKEIDEPEIFQSLYSANVITEKMATLGINYEIKGLYALAFNQFKKAAAANPEETYESSVWTEEMLFCYSQLGQWGDVYKKIAKSVGDNVVDKIWEPKIKDAYLDYFVRSLSRESSLPVTGSIDYLPIIQFYKDAAENESHKEFLLKYYACEWSSMCIVQKQYDLGSQIIQNSYDSLLASWTSLHPLAHTSRLSKLSQLQRTVEIEDYLNLLKKVKLEAASSDQINDFFKTLSTRYPDAKSDPITVWDDLIDTRTIFLRDLMDQNTMVIKSELHAMSRYEVDYNRTMAETAVIQGNNGAGGVKMKKLEKLGAESEVQLYKIQIAQIIFDNVRESKKPELLGNGLKQSINFKGHYTEPAETFRSKIILAIPFILAKDKLMADPNLFQELLENQSFRLAIRDTREAVANAETFINYLETTGYDKLKEAGESVDRESSQYAEYLWKLGNYCDTSLRSRESASSMLQPDINPAEYSKYVVQNYIGAMNKDHREAIENFPRTLDLIEQYPECGPFFQESINNLDSVWRLIRWIPQLISFIETPVAPYVLSALLRISESYPKAVYYHFQMYFEHYDLKKDNMSEENRTAIEKIRAVIRSPIMEEFTIELQRLTNPEHLLKDFTDVIRTMIVGQYPPTSFIDSVFDQMTQLLLNPYSSRMGDVTKSFYNKYRKKLDTALGTAGKNLHSITAETIKKLEEVLDAASNDTQDKKKPLVLKSYAPWLASFKSSEFDEELEIPGQYDGLSKPYPELHAKVASFNSSILIMDSIRKPKKIIINGSDERDYSFLVKGGEDLRLDQRIEQLFAVMNGMLRRNAFCSKQDIQIAIYKVVPMSLSLGIIEWVDNTKPLRSCLSKDRKSSNQIKQAQQIYALWVSKSPSKRGSSAAFQKLFYEDRQKIIQNYNRITDGIEPNLLKDTILQLSSSPEAFLFMRKRYSYSLACIAIFGYILGIGDRHLENFLLNMKSGLLIPIDFGHAFGSATELLPVPEIVPFRLTPQIVAVLSPLGISGILEGPMTTILKAIQDEKSLLLNIMNVFIKDPLLDWKKAAIKQKGIQKGKPSKPPETSDSIDNSEMTSWYPKNKLEIVKRKLNGDNPADIVATEMFNGHSKKSYLDAMVKVAKGDKRHDIRANVGSTCQDTNEQVKCLINLATDKSVLGVMWSGWSPYL